MYDSIGNNCYLFLLFDEFRSSETRQKSVNCLCRHIFYGKVIFKSLFWKWTAYDHLPGTFPCLSLCSTARPISHRNRKSSLWGHLTTFPLQNHDEPPWIGSIHSLISEEAVPCTTSHYISNKRLQKSRCISVETLTAKFKVFNFLKNI